MVAPFMAFFLVEGLGHAPRILSLYSVLAVGLTIWVNRSFGARIDAGGRVFPMVGAAAFGFCVAAFSVAVWPILPVILSVGVIGFGLGSSAVSTMFSLGGTLAERAQIDRSRFNAVLRAVTSGAWMVGPAVAFLVADAFSPRAVFILATGIAILWLGLWWWVLPRGVTAAGPAKPAAQGGDAGFSTALWLAAGYVFCLSLAHSLTFSALPLFYVREVGLPGFAPGTAFSVKTFVEIGAIFATPWIIARFGMARALLATTLLAVATIQYLASVESFPQMLLGSGLEGLYYGLYASLGISYVQSFAQDRPARATALYWNTLMVSALMAGPVVGAIAEVSDFRTVVLVSSGVATGAALLLGATMLRGPRR